MKRICLTALPFLFLFYLSGCIEIFTTIRVKPDGSGTIEKNLMMSKEAIMMISNFFPKRDSSGDKGFDIFDEAKFRNDASEMGDGVSYLSGKKLTTEDKEGYDIIYSFNDISRLKIGENPREIVASPSTIQFDSAARDDYISFDLKKNDPSVLTITLPSEEFQEKKKEQLESAVDTFQIDPETERKIKQMMRGMKMSFVVDMLAGIKETNAAYREGSRIVLAEINFGKLVEDPSNYKRFLSMKDKPFIEAKEFLRTLPGIKIELNHKVEVTFK